MKKGQSHLIPVFILGGIVIVLVFIFGYKAIQGLTSKQETIIRHKIETELRNDIKLISSQYGTARTFSYSGDKIERICFYDKEPVMKGDNIFCPTACSDDRDSFKVDITRDTNNNVFIYEDKIPRSFYIENVRNSCCDFYCAENEGGAISMIIEGKGEYALIGK